MDEEDKEEEEALQRQLKEEEELQKELAQLNKDTKALSKEAARSKVKMKAQKDAFKSMYKKAKKMGLRVDQFKDNEIMRSDEEEEDDEEKDKTRREAKRRRADSRRGGWCEVENQLNKMWRTRWRGRQSLGPAGRQGRATK